MNAFDKLMDLAKGMGAVSVGNENMPSTKQTTRQHVRTYAQRQKKGWVRPSKKRHFINNNKIVNPDGTP